MFQRFKGQYTHWVLIIGGILLLLELFVFNPGLIFSLLVSVGMIYVSKRSLKGLFGKFSFWLGILILSISVLNMFTFKFFLFSVLLYFLMQLMQNKKATEIIKPFIKSKNSTDGLEEPIIKKQVLFTNAIYNRNNTPDHVYEWDDINIQCGLNNTKIDLSYTVLPEGETVIWIRNIIGDVKLYIPYDMEVSINHSTIFGSYRILGHADNHLVNHNVTVKTPDYNKANTRVKIVTSFVVGKLEVKRI
ncbi:cell wall-active antibiotics response protein LiaF [Bacillus sp. B1-b2]|uniref:cell wall-active antibiotics response protein LiaF n=1 Tax=Bacillus sp. B1-b2 TaxID=2653201 RepID=UPI0012614508|nr:cell wall-active antibiotics response protein LiaF [Bacillus sp. B1-b2]KAB7672503.1 cell wall-active antibiotics response protein [Bacillus sp. B1-b2]